MGELHPGKELFIDDFFIESLHGAHRVLQEPEKMTVDQPLELPFEKAWERRETMEYHNQKFWVASRQDIIASKRAAGRPKDLEDVRILELEPEENG